MTKQETIAALDHLSREQLLELVYSLARDAAEKQEELDKIKGIIR